MLPDSSVSVIIPTYNRAHLVSRAVDSVLVAIAPGDEVIVVDDGSTDDTSAVLAKYCDYVRVVRLPNKGAGAARNRGIAEARHPLIAFLDSDDEWTADRLVLGRRLLAARSDVLFCFSDFGLREAGLPEQHHGLAGWHPGAPPWCQMLGRGVRYSTMASLPDGRDDFSVHIGWFYSPLLEWGIVAPQTLLVRRDQAGESLKFPEDVPTSEDWECSARIGRVGRGAFMDCETAWQWGHNAPRLTDTDAFRRATARLAIVERVWAADRAFSEGNRERVRQAIRKQRLIRARWLLRRGLNAEARTELALAGDSPVSYRCLAALPGCVTRGLFGARAMVRRVLPPSEKS
jgi:hypothetical protein